MPEVGRNVPFLSHSMATSIPIVLTDLQEHGVQPLLNMLGSGAGAESVRVLSEALESARNVIRQVSCASPDIILM
jgi:hypothetical protein